jgi:hypothetical protein
LKWNQVVRKRTRKSGHGQTVIQRMRPPDRGFEHMIALEAGATPVITMPYRHPKRFKDEIEKANKELLVMGHMRQNTSPFASSVILVLKKDGT